jgi:hypothetical protein
MLFLWDRGWRLVFFIEYDGILFFYRFNAIIKVVLDNEDLLYD